MAYNSAHTGPEIDAAVQMLGQIQSARAATASDLAGVVALAFQVGNKASQVASQAASVDTKTAQVLASASAVEQAHAETLPASATAVAAKDTAVLAAGSAQTSQESAGASASAAGQSQIEAGLSEQISAENAASTSADRLVVEELAQQVAVDSASAAASAQNAAAVVTGGTATFSSSPGKIPLGDGQGKIDSAWLGADIARADAVQAATALANDSLEAIAEIKDATNPAKGAVKVGYDGGTVQDVLDYAKPLAGYAALRAYTGRAKSIRLTNAGTDGWFVPSANQADPDDNFVTIMDGLGRKWRRVFSGRVNVKWAGAKGDGSADDSAAAQIALTYVALNKCTLYWPAGRYVILNTQTATAASDGNFNFEGDGVGTTIIELNTSGNGFELTLPGNYWLFGAGGSNGFRSSNITYSTTNAKAGNGIVITGNCVEGRPGPMLQFESCEFRGKNGFSQFWETAVKTIDVGDIWITSVRCMIGGPTNTTGTFLDVTGTAQANSPICVHITDPQIYFGGEQIKMGSYVEGVYLTQPHMVAGQVGLKWNPVGGESGLHLLGGHISSYQTCLDLNNLFDVNWSSTLIYRAGSNANWRGAYLKNIGRINAGAGMVFKGNYVDDGETGIYIESSINNEKYGTMLAGIAFHQMGSRAIWLGANANYVQVGKNMYRQCALRVLNQSVNNNIEFVPATYSVTKNITLVGGATIETYDLALPAGTFRSKPLADGTGNGTNGLLVTGDFDSASTTATNARFVISKRDGSVLSAGTFRVILHCTENFTGGQI